MSCYRSCSSNLSEKHFTQCSPLSCSNLGASQQEGEASKTLTDDAGYFLPCSRFINIYLLFGVNVSMHSYSETVDPQYLSKREGDVVKLVLLTRRNERDEWRIESEDRGTPNPQQKTRGTPNPQQNRRQNYQLSFCPRLRSHRVAYSASRLSQTIHLYANCWESYSKPLALCFAKYFAGLDTQLTSLFLIGNGQWIVWMKLLCNEYLHQF